MKRKAEKNMGKRKGEAGETEEKKKKKGEKSQLTLGQWMGPTNIWKILSNDKWVMVPKWVGYFKWWVMSDEWQKLSYEKYWSKQSLKIKENFLTAKIEFLLDQVI